MFAVRIKKDSSRRRPLFALLTWLPQILSLALPWNADGLILAPAPEADVDFSE